MEGFESVGFERLGNDNELETLGKSSAGSLEGVGGGVGSEVKIEGGFGEWDRMRKVEEGGIVKEVRINVQ